MILGLGFIARSGKDLTADYLVREYGFKKLSFAGALKSACGEVFGFSEEQLYGKLKEKVDPYWKKTPREVLQLVGTELFRNHFDQDIWIKALQRKILQNPESDHVISDVRFRNEAQAIKDLGGYVVRVDRPGVGAKPIVKKYLFGLIKREVQHESELQMMNYDKWDDSLQNNGTVKDLYLQIDGMIDDLHRRNHV